MANTIGWGQAAVNNTIDWGKGKTNNAIGWGSIYSVSPSGETDISGTPAGDADANAFIAAAAITDTTQKAAIDKLVVDLKGYGIWTKMKAIYPFIGGTAAQHKFNLRSPLDTNAAFRLVFNGGWTHSATGALPNGTNAYANSFLIPSAQLLLNSTSVVYYSRTTSATGNCFGAENAALANRILWQCSGGTNYVSLYTTPANYFSYNGTTLSMLIANRTASNLSNAWAGNVKRATSTNPSVGLTDTPIYIGCNNANNIPTAYSNAQCAFSSIGDGLTDTEASNYYAAVQTFQTTLGRNV